MTRPKLATVWLDGCSGCHMSFLDMDEYLLDVLAVADLVYSPLVDNKTFPPDVDVTFVEGAVSSAEDHEKIKHIRARTRYLVSLGDCAVTGNVPSMRNVFPVDEIAKRAYEETVTVNAGLPTQVVPPLLPKVRPVHQVVKVDLIVPGCPPPAQTIRFVVDKLLADEKPDLGDLARFG